MEGIYVRKRLTVMITVFILALVLIVPAAQAAQTGAVRAPGLANCVVLANGGLPFAEFQKNNHDVGLHRAHKTPGAVFGSEAACLTL